MHDCNWCRQNIDAYIDGELTQADAEALRAHIASCPDCAQQLQAHTRLRELCAEATVEPPAAFSAAWRDAVREEAAQQRFRPAHRRPIWRYATLAAGLVLVFAAVATLSRSNLFAKRGDPFAGAAQAPASMAADAFEESADAAPEAAMAAPEMGTMAAPEAELADEAPAGGMQRAAGETDDTLLDEGDDDAPEADAAKSAAPQSAPSAASGGLQPFGTAEPFTCEDFFAPVILLPSGLTDPEAIAAFEADAFEVLVGGPYTLTITISGTDAERLFLRQLDERGIAYERVDGALHTAQDGAALSEALDAAAALSSLALSYDVAYESGGTAPGQAIILFRK